MSDSKEEWKLMEETSSEDLDDTIPLPSSLEVRDELEETIDISSGSSGVKFLKEVTVVDITSLSLGGSSSTTPYPQSSPPPVSSPLEKSSSTTSSSTSSSFSESHPRKRMIYNPNCHVHDHHLDETDDRLCPDDPKCKCLK